METKNRKKQRKQNINSNNGGRAGIKIKFIIKIFPEIVVIINSQ